MQTSNELVKYNFSQPELIELSREQNRYFNEKKEADDNFASVRSDYKNIVTKLEADINRVGQRVTSGYEMRQIKCLVLKSRPDNDSLLIVRLDNGRVYKRRKMNADERQIPISTEPPELYEFEADLYEDSESDIATEVAPDCPLTAKEAKELGEVEGFRIRPLAKKLTDGKPPAKDGKKGK